MGTSFVAYLLSWMVFFILNGIVIVGIFIMILGVSGVFDNSTEVDIFKILGLYLLLMFATLSFCMMISSFFSNAQLAAQVVTFMQIIGLGLFFLIQIKGFR